MKRKKGLEQAMVVKMLGIIASFILIAMLLHKAFDVTYNETAENVCRMSVVSHAKTQAGGSPIMNLKCPRKFITFDDDGYKIYYADELPIDKEKLSYQRKFKDDISKKKQFYEVMANEMAECWYKMGEGELDVFSDKMFFNTQSCLICSQISFSKDFDESTDLGTVREFNNYLESNNFTKYGMNERYKDFLYENYPAGLSLRWLMYTLEENSVKVLFDEGTKMTPGKPYLVYFKAYKFDKFNQFLNWGGKKLIGEEIDRVFPNDRYFVYFGFQEDVTNTNSCNMVIN